MRISDWSSDVCSSDLRLDAAVEQKAAAIEHHLGDARLLGSRSDALADARRRVDIRTRLGARAFFECGRGRDRLALGVVDHLGLDVLARAMHRKPRAGTRARTTRGAVAPAALLRTRKNLCTHLK